MTFRGCFEDIMPFLVITITRQTAEELLEKGVLQKNGVELRIQEGGKRNILLDSKDVIRAEKRKVETRRAVIPSGTEQKIIEEWDNHISKLNQLNIKVRSQKVGSTTTSVLTELRQMSKELFKAVQHEMGLYFSACESRKHNCNGHDYSYSTLITFLRALIRFDKDNRAPWWKDATDEDLLSIDDATKALAKKIAKAFCSEFMASRGRSDQLWEGPKQRNSLVQAALKTQQVVSNYPSVSEDTVIDLLMSGLRNESKGSVVFVGALCSDNTWNVIMPQYLEQIM